MKKRQLLATAVLAALTLAACGQAGASTPKASSDQINVVSREEGSGTRSAFEELVEVNTNDDNHMTQSAIIKDGNGTVATDVAGKAEGIGYVSFSTLDENPGKIKGLRVNGIEPTHENVLNGSYGLKRPFIAVFMENELTEPEKAFLDFLTSLDGLEALEAADGIVDKTGAEPFDASKYPDLKGDMVLGGSTSTEHAINEVATEFKALFPNVSYSYDATGSGAGITGAQEGNYGIGFSSRDLKEEELASGLGAQVICMDGIAIIVHPGNELNDISIDQIRDVYLGNKTLWSELLK